MNLDVQICSVRECTYNDRRDGSRKTFYRCYVILDDGSVGSVASFRQHKPGDIVTLSLVLNRQGDIGVRIVED